MKQKPNFQPLLADMHTDGVRFDPKILAAVKQQAAIVKAADPARPEL